MMKKDNYIVYKGVRMTEQEAEAKINNAYCDAADRARGVKPSTVKAKTKQNTAKPKKK